MKHKHSLGHILYAFGCLLLLFVITIMHPANLGLSKAISTNAVVDLTNQSRERLGKNPLSINSSLMSAAQAKAEDMATKKYFDHYGPNGETPWEFFKQAGYDYEYAGENLAITNEGDQQVIDGWLNSPAHRENMLSENYTQFGIGVASFGDYKNHKNTTVIVAMYGKPKNTTASVQGVASEKTAPAGALPIIQNDILGSNGLAILAALGFALILAGVFYEVRHIKRHNTPHFN